MGVKLELAIAALNGAIGDYLGRTGNGLATRMTLVHAGQPLLLTREALRSAYPSPGPRVVLLVHGLMCTEEIWRLPDGSDYGSLLERDLGWTPLYLRFNSGLAILENGAALARLLEGIVEAYPAPLEELALIGFSLGGLVLRSACHSGLAEGHRWPRLVRRAFYLGTPHRGSPLERAGRVLARLLRSIPDPYTRLIGELGDLRSDGIKDLGDADLRGRERRTPRLGLRDPAHPVPLLPGIRHHLVAASLARDPRIGLLFGDLLVPIGSAIDGADRSTDQVRIVPAAGHLRLAHDPRVYDLIRTWCEEETAR
jgi:hypothetical protein